MRGKLELMLLTACLIAVQLATITSAQKTGQAHDCQPSLYIRPSNRPQGYKPPSDADAEDPSDVVDKLTDEEIFDRINEIVDQEMTADLHELLTALTTDEGQTALRFCGVDPTTIQALLGKIKGSPTDCSQAKRSFKNIVGSLQQMLNRRNRIRVRGLLRVYASHLNRLAAAAKFRQSSLEALTEGLRVLADLEEMYWFRGIIFSDLLKTLTDRGAEGLEEVKDKIAAWVATADCLNLKVAVMVYSKAVQYIRTTAAPPTTPTAPPTTTSAPPTTTTVIAPNFIVIVTKTPAPPAALAAAMETTLAPPPKTTVAPPTTTQAPPTTTTQAVTTTVATTVSTTTVTPE